MTLEVSTPRMYETEVAGATYTIGTATYSAAAAGNAVLNVPAGSYVVAVFVCSAIAQTPGGASPTAWLTITGLAGTACSCLAGTPSPPIDSNSYAWKGNFLVPAGGWVITITAGGAGAAWWYGTVTVVYY